MEVLPALEAPRRNRFDAGEILEFIERLVDSTLGQFISEQIIQRFDHLGFGVTDFEVVVDIHGFKYLIEYVPVLEIDDRIVILLFNNELEGSFMEPRILDGHARRAVAESQIGLEFDLDRRGFVRLVVGKYLEPGYIVIFQRIGNLRLGGFNIGLELKLQGGAIKGDMDRFGDLSDRFKGFEIRLLNGQCTLHGSTLVGCRDFDLGFPIRDALSGHNLYDTLHRIVRIRDNGGGYVVASRNGYYNI